MKTKLGIAVTALALIAMCGGAFAYEVTTGTATVGQAERYGNGVTTVAWTSNADGGVVVTGINLFGQITKIVTDPGATAPSDNYDIALTDASGSDVLLGTGNNRDTTNTESVVFGLATSGVFSTTTLYQDVNTNERFVPWRVDVYGSHTLTISSAGDTKKGTIRIYTKR